jgi:hypothetical protein
MTDTTTSGAPEGPAAEPAAAAESSAFGAFGSARGSGLARGKRNHAPAPAATAAPTAYKPTALEVITPAREYRNPFTGEMSVNPPAESPAPAPAPEAEAPAPAPAAEAPAAAEPAAAAPAPAEEAPAPQAPAPAAEDSRPELTILPPAEVRQSALSWENRPRDERPEAPAPRRDERGERHERRDRGERWRDERPAYRPEPRPDHRADDRRGEEHRRPAPLPAAPPPAKGFFGWLKSLFAGPAAAPAVADHRSADSEIGRDGQPRRRRRRGGRGRHHGEPGGRPAEAYPARASEGAEHGERTGAPYGSGESRDGHHRRRRRGGRGRYRGDRGGPGPEGQQGGGAI